MISKAQANRFPEEFPENLKGSMPTIEEIDADLIGLDDSSE
ncbi:hypothetical protein [Maridesulfovibrio frigidus]|nr:hypothetical protein [Maridesulfovibrio frigidus]